MVDFWKMGKLDLGDNGYYLVFQIFGGEHNTEYFTMKYINQEAFDDFSNLDKGNRVVINSELYKSIEFDMEAGNIEYFNSINGAMNNAIITAWEEKTSSMSKDQIKEYTENLFKYLSKYLRI